MDDLINYTPTELLKMINDSKVEHDRFKQEIIDQTIELDNLEKSINEKIELINNKILAISAIEKKYILLIEELNNRENAV
jgi:hypothetical protein